VRLAFDPTERQLGLTVGAMRGDHVWRPALAAIKREVFAHNPNLLGIANYQIRGDLHRLPKSAQIPPHERPGTAMIKILERRVRPVLNVVRSHLKPLSLSAGLIKRQHAEQAPLQPTHKSAKLLATRVFRRYL
jgi:hypothetical protein